MWMVKWGASIVAQNWRIWTMRGSKARKLRLLARHSVKNWRVLGLKDKYRITEHIKIINKVKHVSLQLLTRGSRAYYIKLKRLYKDAHATQHKI